MLHKPAFPLLRPMHASDIDSVSQIEATVYTHGWSRGIFLDCLRTEYSNWVFELESCIVGYGVMSVYVGEAHILNIAIEPSCQGYGMGRQMLTHLLRVGWRLGAQCAFLEVRASNQVALGLYESAGFNQVGTRPGYYPSPKGREDAVIMVRELTESP